MMKTTKFIIRVTNLFLIFVLAFGTRTDSLWKYIRKLYKSWIFGLYLSRGLKEHTAVDVGVRSKLTLCLHKQIVSNYENKRWIEYTYRVFLSKSLNEIWKTYGLQAIFLNFSLFHPCYGLFLPLRWDDSSPAFGFHYAYRYK
jgi:hypothetical protein